MARAAAQLVAAIADIDLPRNQWSSLMMVLVENTKPENLTHVKKSSLLAIGYICEIADPLNSGVNAQASGILTAIIQGAASSEPNPVVRLTAIQALVNSLQFIRDNFAQEGERNYIMQVVCEATQSEDPDLQAAAFGAMARIMSVYYRYMSIYMQKALFGLTVTGMKSDNENVAMNAVEFWSTVCEEEIDITLSNSEYQSMGHTVYEENFKFAEHALDQVLPTIFSLLPKQEDTDDDDDDWNISMAAGACLKLYAQNVGIKVVPFAIKFVDLNLQSQKWNEREAAVMAFGSILEGPDPEQLSPLVDQALPLILSLMKDSHLQVRDTVAWCLGTMAYVKEINYGQHLQAVLEALVVGLGDHPKVVSNCCWTIMNITEQLNDPDQETSPLSQYYSIIIEALLGLSSKVDNENSYRTSAYEALSSLVIFSPKDVQPLVRALSTEIVTRLEASLEAQKQGFVSEEEKNNLQDLQINMLSLLTNIIRRVGEDVSAGSDTLMTLFLNMLHNKFPNSLVEDDILIAISSVTGAIGTKFDIYMEALMPFVLSALNEPELKVCATAVGLISDISHALGSEIEKYFETFMKVLGELIQNPITPKSLQPKIFSCFGDIASNLGPNFSFVLEDVMRVINDASTSSDINLSIDVDYVTELKTSILDAYVGIVDGLQRNPNALLPYVKTIFDFLKAVSYDIQVIRHDSAVRNLAGLLGDIASMYPPGQLQELYNAEWVTEFLKKARSDNVYTETTRATARWARAQQKTQL